MATTKELLLFQEHAEPLARATGLEWLSFGIVYTTDAGQARSLSFSMELGSREEPRREFQVGPVTALGAPAPQSELGPLITQLLGGRLERLGQVEFPPPV